MAKVSEMSESEISEALATHRKRKLTLNTEIYQVDRYINELLDELVIRQNMKQQEGEQ